MADTEETTTGTEEQPAPPAPPAGEETPTPDPTDEETGAPEAGEEENSDETDESGQKLSYEAMEKELGRVRAEAASRRTRVRELEDSLKEAKTPDEVNAAISEFQEKLAAAEQQITMRDVADAHDIPKDLRSFLTGKTEEELVAQAKALQKFATPAPPATLSGGVEPDDDDDGEYDPGKLAAKYRRGY